VAFDAFMLGTPRVGQLVLSLPDFTRQSSGSKESCQKRWMPGTRQIKSGHDGSYDASTL
jgi:hypothetical protein